MSLPMVTIKEASTNEEWEQAIHLFHEVYVGGGYTNSAVAQQMQTREKLEPAGIFLIAKNEHDQVVGAVVSLHPDSVLQQLARPGEHEFRMLAVGTNARGRGVGEALVRACIDRAHMGGATSTVLWTQPTMKAAQRLYERLGFERDPSRDVPDPRGWDRLVYVLSYAE
ncbi:MAG: GNAT family N-acetyltransferase [Flavobacteriales bacterium]|nr:GNAT family N-acetyltransferase [Flavobacteriales bacterium]MBL0044701.1 GNAT family N-acetyltransferase [Flavobacteriales bacterium]